MLDFKIVFLFAIVSISSTYCCGKYGGKGCGGGGSSDTINAAVISKHIFKVKDVPSSSHDIDIPTIVINSGSTPLKIQMGSSSSEIDISQDHQSSKPQMKQSSSVDGAIILKHFVKKPIIQKVHEIIVPQRKIIQEVLPVKEFIKTIISQSQTTSAPDTTPAPKPKYYYYKKKPTTAAPTTTEADTTTEGHEYMDYFF